MELMMILRYVPDILNARYEGIPPMSQMYKLPRRSASFYSNQLFRPVLLLTIR